MSARRFAALLTGLSASSVWRARAAGDLSTIDDPRAAERAVERALGV